VSDVLTYGMLMDVGRFAAAVPCRSRLTTFCMPHTHTHTPTINCNGMKLLQCNFSSNPKTNAVKIWHSLTMDHDHVITRTRKATGENNAKRYRPQAIYSLPVAANFYYLGTFRRNINSSSARQSNRK